MEIDGAQHSQGLGRLEDALRDNAQALEGRVTLRLPVIGLRLDPAGLLNQVTPGVDARGLAAGRRRECYPFSPVTISSPGCRPEMTWVKLVVDRPSCTGTSCGLEP